jgi:hypothetical protein
MGKSPRRVDLLWERVQEELIPNQSKVAEFERNNKRCCINDKPCVNNCQSTNFKHADFSIIHSQHNFFSHVAALAIRRQQLVCNTITEHEYNLLKSTQQIKIHMMNRNNVHSSVFVKHSLTAIITIFQPDLHLYHL